MKEPTHKEQKELWEWCGFTPIEGRWYRLPEGFFERRDGVPFNAVTPLPPIDLNNLFEYAVPIALKIITEQGYCPPIMKSPMV